MSEICSKICKLNKKNILKRRVCVITCGPSPAYISEYDFILEEETFSGYFMPEPMEESKLVDTNGAGDAFAGGFLAKWIFEEPLDFCMKQVE